MWFGCAKRLNENKLNGTGEKEAQLCVAKCSGNKILNHVCICFFKIMPTLRLSPGNRHFLLKIVLKIKKTNNKHNFRFIYFIQKLFQGKYCNKGTKAKFLRFFFIEGSMESTFGLLNHLVLQELKIIYIHQLKKAQ